MMTRKEAIQHLENIIIFSYQDGYSDEAREALKMAIAILQAKPCEDAVSRTEVLKGYIEIERADGMEVYSDKAVPTEYINNLPPVTSKPKTGKWIKYAAPRCGEQHYKCTNCDDYINFGQYGDYYTKDFKFCPHCGAKMEGVNE